MRLGKASRRAAMAVLDVAAARGIPATVLARSILPRPMFAKLDPDSESNIIRDELTLLCAAPYAERIASQKALQEAGCKICVRAAPFPVLA
ncbi:MAG: hypothetical protein J6J61_08335 [Muribaculaceae bacterium]|nr:hypothetical protein [Muribaculaceae bacterium]